MKPVDENPTVRCQLKAQTFPRLAEGFPDELGAPPGQWRWQ